MTEGIGLIKTGQQGRNSYRGKLAKARGTADAADGSNERLV